MAKKRKKKSGFPLAKIALAGVALYLLTRKQQPTTTPPLPGDVYTDPVPQTGMNGGKTYFLIA